MLYSFYILDICFVPLHQCCEYAPVCWASGFQGRLWYMLISTTRCAHSMSNSGRVHARPLHMAMDDMRSECLRAPFAFTAVYVVYHTSTEQMVAE